MSKNQSREGGHKAKVWPQDRHTSWSATAGRQTDRAVLILCLYWQIIRADWGTHRWIQETRYFSIFFCLDSTTPFISSNSAWICLCPKSSSSSPTKRSSRALPRERKVGRFSTVNSGCNETQRTNEKKQQMIIFLHWLQSMQGAADCCSCYSWFLASKPLFSFDFDFAIFIKNLCNTIAILSFS